MTVIMIALIVLLFIGDIVVVAAIINKEFSAAIINKEFSSVDESCELLEKQIESNQETVNKVVDALRDSDKLHKVEEILTMWKNMKHHELDAEVLDRIYEIVYGAEGKK